MVVSDPLDRRVSVGSALPARAALCRSFLGASRPMLELARNLAADEATAEMMLCARKPSEPLSLYLAFLVFSGLLKKT